MKKVLREKHKNEEKWIDMHTLYWNLVASNYDDFYKDKWSQDENDGITNKLSWIKTIPNCEILDLGCGTGLGYQLCHKINPTIKYHGLDISSEMVRKAKRKFPNAIFEVGDMANLSGFEEASLDAVICIFTTFSYTNRPSKVVKETYRILKPGGRIFFSVLNRWSLRRILKGRISEVENYRTRKSRLGKKTVPAYVYSINDLKQLFGSEGFKDVSITGQSIFGGVLEQEKLWRVDAFLSKPFSFLCHSLNIQAKKCNILE